MSACQPLVQAHITQRSNNIASSGHCFRFNAFVRIRDPQIQPIIDQKISWLDIPMKYLLIMGIINAEQPEPQLCNLT